MKRVDTVYLVKTCFGDFGIVTRPKYKSGNHQVLCFRGITDGNKMLLEDKTLDGLFKKIDAAGFTMNVFVNYRAAMQYYIEQTKEVEGE